jgi:hypothetical protein
VQALIDLAIEKGFSLDLHFFDGGFSFGVYRHESSRYESNTEEIYRVWSDVYDRALVDEAVESVYRKIKSY